MVWAATLAAVAFQQFVIGMPLEEARQVDLGEDRFGQIVLLCNGDEGAPRQLEVSAEEARIGVSRCWPTRDGGRSSIQVGEDIAATTEFMFLDGTLAEITTHYDQYNAHILETALRQRYGEPTLTREDARQNTFGATIPRTTLLWVIDDQSVSFMAPSLTARRMTITYSHTPSVSAVQNAREAAEQDNLRL